MLLLLAHDETATVSQDLSRTIPTSYWDTGALNYLTILLDSAPGLQIPSEVSAEILQYLIRRSPYSAEEVECEKKHLELFIRHKRAFGSPRTHVGPLRKKMPSIRS